MVIGAGLGASREVPVDGDSETLLPAVLTFRHSYFAYTRRRRASRRRSPRFRF